MRLATIMDTKRQRCGGWCYRDNCVAIGEEWHLRDESVGERVHPHPHPSALSPSLSSRPPIRLVCAGCANDLGACFCPVLLCQ